MIAKKARPFAATTACASTGGADCLGRSVDHEKYPTTNGQGFELLFRQNGTEAYVCGAPGVIRLKNGKVSSIQTMENCWGELTPLEQ